MTARAIIYDVADHRSRAIESSLTPIEASRTILRERAGVDISVARIENSRKLTEAIRNDRPDHALLLTDWAQSLRFVEYCAAAAREGLGDRGSLSIFDTYDPTSTPHLGVLPLVDRYLKKAVYADPTWYTREFLGGYVVTHRLAGELGYSLGRHDFSSLATLDQVGKVRLSWCFGASPLSKRLLMASSVLGKSWERRKYDVSCRLGANEHELGLTGGALEGMNWYKRHRLEALRAIRSAESRRQGTRTTPSDRCSRRAYLLELMRTRLVISPFGYGELCYRDYEAVCCGCLLLKPDVSHLRTSPDIFEAGVTYVPLRWDFSDATERIAHYLDHPDEARAIVRAAQERMRAYFAEQGIVGDVRRALEGLRVP